MIAFETRKEDLEEQSMILEILASLVVIYERTKDERFIPHLSFWEEELDKIQAQLKGDYLEKEKKYKRVIETLQAVRALQ